MTSLRYYCPNVMVVDYSSLLIDYIHSMEACATRIYTADQYLNAC